MVGQLGTWDAWEQVTWYLTSGMSIVAPKSGYSGPAKLITTSGYNTSLAISTLKHLIIAQKLKRGAGPDGVSMPDCRRAERLFGSVGRLSYASSHVKLEKLGDDYDPKIDTCIKAFVRLIARVAHDCVVNASAEEALAK